LRRLGSRHSFTSDLKSGKQLFFKGLAVAKDCGCKIIFLLKADLAPVKEKLFNAFY
jgi:hypothetical protein